MFTDFTDPIQNLKRNPIERILARNNKPFLFYDEQYTFWSQFFELYRFKRYGIGFIGQYAPEDLPLLAQIRIEKTGRHEDILDFSLTAPYKYYKTLGMVFPPDFLETLILDSNKTEIFPWKEIDARQQITFSHDKGVSSTFGLSAHIYLPNDTLSITKVDSKPVEVVSEMEGTKVHDITRYISRQA